MLATRVFVATSLVLLNVLGPASINSVSAASVSSSPRVVKGIARRHANFLRARSLGALQDASDSASEGSRMEKRQAGNAMSKDALTRISAGLISTMTKFCAATDAGGQLPTQEEMSQAVGKAIQSTDTNNRIQAARAIKASIDELADNKLAQAQSGGGGKKLDSRQLRPSRNAGGAGASAPVSQENIDKIAAALLETIKKYCAAKSAGAELPTPEEVSAVLSQAIKNSDLRDRTQSAKNVKAGLDRLADEKLAAAQAKSGSNDAQ